MCRQVALCDFLVVVLEHKFALLHLLDAVDVRLYHRVQRVLVCRKRCDDDSPEGPFSGRQVCNDILEFSGLVHGLEGIAKHHVYLPVIRPVVKGGGYAIQVVVQVVVVCTQVEVHELARLATEIQYRADDERSLCLDREGVEQGDGFPENILVALYKSLLYAGHVDGRHVLDDFHDECLRYESPAPACKRIEGIEFLLIDNRGVPVACEYPIEVRVGLDGGPVRPQANRVGYHECAPPDKNLPGVCLLAICRCDPLLCTAVIDLLHVVGQLEQGVVNVWGYRTEGGLQVLRRGLEPCIYGIDMRHGPCGKAFLVFFADAVAKDGVAVFAVPELLGWPALLVWVQVCLDFGFLDGPIEHEGGVPVEFRLQGRVDGIGQLVYEGGVREVFAGLGIEHAVKAAFCKCVPGTRKQQHCREKTQCPELTHYSSLPRPQGTFTNKLQKSLEPGNR